jgi:hypothetical protein
MQAAIEIRKPVDSQQLTVIGDVKPDVRAAFNVIPQPNDPVAGVVW